jgi:uncharacterized protein YcbX
MEVLANPEIQSIHIYPVKSLPGVEVCEWPLDAWGLLGDRRYMLIDSQGRFMSQRGHPAMAKFSVCIETDEWQITSNGSATFTLPMIPDAFTSTMQVKVWDSVFEAGYVSDAADAFFSAALGVACRLVAVLPESPRLEGDGLTTWQVAMSDASPILVVSSSSIDALNRALQENGEEPVGLKRFRPNLVLRGMEPFAEDHIETIILGNSTLKFIKRCSRCIMVNLNDQGEFGAEPLRTLATFRRDANKVYFGSHYRAVSFGVLRV